MAPEGIFVVSSMCGEPKSEEAKASCDARSLCLLRGGYPYRTLKPLPELCRELTDAGFDVLDAKLAINPWWDHATIVCR
ncbi:hypothetical protein [Bradyrhizobium sp. LHD-71]|uniref:hypothetical protein n=1 Tax=Bradyrhizobium sp. LHD-71 TaxID=3072141 RepID=UPI00280E0490|nr:hypothetical protein [Bradyrhizobium sp. LHD-71]MDQ8729588.1 hypothetical protein [Bradyrhizobium sp. LHD-71]